MQYVHATDIHSWSKKKKTVGARWSYCAISSALKNAACNILTTDN